MTTKIMDRRIKMITCMILILTLLTSCGKGGNNKVQESESDSSTTEVLFIAYSNYEEPLKNVVDQFKKSNPEINVKLELAPFNQLMETIEIKMGAKTEDVDLLFVDSPLVVNYAVKGYLEPLDDYFSFDPKDVWADEAVNGATYQDNLVAAPLNSSSQVLYLNKDIFKEKGVPLPAEDERMTWEETIEIAKKLTYDTNNDGHNDVFGFSFDQVDRAYQLLALSDSLGVEMVSEDGLTTDGYINSPEAVKAFQFYYDLFNTWGVSPKIDREESIDYFISGKIAMFLGANHNLPKLEESDLNYGVTLHPYFEGHEVATPTGAWNVGISKYSKNKEAAAKFLEYLTADLEGAKTFFEVGGTLPVHLELLDYIANDPQYDDFPNNIIRISAKESQETAVSRPKTPGYLEWETNMNRAFENIKNGTDPKEALDNAAEEIDRLLKKYEGVTE